MDKIVKYYVHSDEQRAIIDREDVVTIDGKKYRRGNVQEIVNPQIRVEFHLIQH